MYFEERDSRDSKRLHFSLNFKSDGQVFIKSTRITHWINECGKTDISDKYRMLFIPLSLVPSKGDKPEGDIVLLWIVTRVVT